MPLDPASWPAGGGGGGIDFGPVANEGDELTVVTTADNLELRSDAGDLVLQAGDSEARLGTSSGDFRVDADDDIVLTADNVVSITANDGELNLTASGASGDISISAEKACVLGGLTMGFFNTFPGSTQPVIPAAPTVQDVVDALVALGLVSQAP